MIYPIDSETNRSNALAYMADYIKSRLLFKYLGMHIFQDECLEIKIVTAPGMPQQQDYRWGWGGNSAVAGDWLVAEIIAYLEAHEANLVILEDPCASPSDPFLKKEARVPAWFYKERVFWPITQDMATRDLINKAMAWGLGGVPQLIGFSRLIASVHNISTDIVIDEDVLIELGSSMKRLVTDIFDNEGYLVWTRK